MSSSKAKPGDEVLRCRWARYVGGYGRVSEGPTIRLAWKRHRQRPTTPRGRYVTLVTNHLCFIRAGRLIICAGIAARGSNSALGWPPRCISELTRHPMVTFAAPTARANLKRAHQHLASGSQKDIGEAKGATRCTRGPSIERQAGTTSVARRVGSSVTDRSFFLPRHPVNPGSDRQTLSSTPVGRQACATP